MLLTAGKSPWKNKELINSPRDMEQIKKISKEKNEINKSKLREIGYICGKHLRDFRPGFGFVHHASRAKGEVFDGLLHVVPSCSPDIDLISQFFRSQMSKNRPFFMKPEIWGRSCDSNWIIYNHGTRSLFAHLKATKRLTEASIRLIAAEICVALKHIHDQNLTFPSLCPEKVFLTDKGHVRLSDLWFDSKLAHKAHEDETVLEYQTPDFLESGIEDDLCDWYRLGVLMYECLCGIPPFYSLSHKKSEIETKIKQSAEKLNSLQFPRDTSPLFKRFVLTLLGPRSVREKYRKWTELETDPFFSSIKFDMLTDTIHRKRKVQKIKRYDLKVVLKSARDLRLGLIDEKTSIICGLKMESEFVPHTSDPVPYSGPAFDFKNRNIFVFQKLPLSATLQLFLHLRNASKKVIKSSETAVKLAILLTGNILDVGAKFNKWVDFSCSDSNVIGDIKLDIEILGIHETEQLLVSDLKYNEYFEIKTRESSLRMYNEETEEKRRDSNLAPSTSKTEKSTASKDKIEATPSPHRKTTSDHGGKRILDIFRGLLSKQNKRFRKDDFDLDLSYITPRLIAMGHYHNGHFKVYNLCSERSYPASKFDGCLSSEYSFENHGCPEMQAILDFCLDVDEYLTKDAKNIAAVHCKVGKGRTGLMLACYLLYAEICPSAATALRLFSLNRTQDNSTVTYPSQKRYVEYFEKYLREYHWRDPPRVLDFHASTKVLQHVRMSVMKSSDSLNFQISDTQGRILTEIVSKKSPQILDERKRMIGHSCNIPISGDRKITFFHGKKFDHPFCWVWFNTNFIQGDILRLSNRDIDGLHLKKEKSSDNGNEFTIELFFLSGHTLEILDRATR
ncbi:hypothetical protein AAMO2058_001133400 [Amorphochlora amoebiformis]